MKRLLIIPLVVLQLFVFGQTKTVTIIKEKIETINIEYQKVINIENNDTSYMVFIWFQNSVYSTITDIRVILLYTNVLLSEFIKDISDAQKQTGKDDVDWDRKYYKIHFSGETKFITLYDERYIGYTYLYSKKMIDRFISVLKSINLSKDYLATR